MPYLLTAHEGSRGVLQEQTRARLVCATQQIASAKLIQLHVRRKRTHRMTPVSPLTLRYSAIPSSNTRVGVSVGCLL